MRREKNNTADMEKGKRKCEILKAIRTYVAEKYGLDYTPTTCTHQGNCPGTCPLCDAELAHLQQQLEAKGITDLTQDETLREMVESYTADQTSPSSPLGGLPAPQDVSSDDEEMMELEGDVPAPVEVEPTIEGMPLEGEPGPIDWSQPQRRLLMECPVAGIGFHDIFDIWDELYEGAEIALVRERNNPYDANAVAVALADDYDGDPDNFDFNFILGYIPRTCNSGIAAMLDSGWENTLEAEISEMKEYGPYSDRLHIAIYINNQEPKDPNDNRLRLMPINNEDEWNSLVSEIWENGFAFRRWRVCFPEPEGTDIEPTDKGDKVVFIHQGKDESKLYLMRVLAVGDDCRPFLDKKKREDLYMVDDCTAFVLSVISGPITVKNEELDFMENELKTGWHPHSKVEQSVSDKLMGFWKDKVEAEE